MARGGRGTGRGRGRGRESSSTTTAAVNAKAPTAATKRGRAGETSVKGTWVTRSSRVESTDEDVTLLARRVCRPRSHTAAAASVQQRNGASRSAPVFGAAPAPEAVRPALRATENPTLSSNHSTHHGGTRGAAPAAAAAVSPLQLFRRCVGRTGLTHALRGCGLAPAAAEESTDHSNNSSAATDRPYDDSAALVETFYAIGDDRLSTALQCLVDLDAIAIYIGSDDPRPTRVRDSGSNTKSKKAEAGEEDHGGAAGGWWVARRLVKAAVALARLCDAAVPVVRPPLVSADAMTAAIACTTETTNGNGTAAAAIYQRVGVSPRQGGSVAEIMTEVVPMPVNMLAAHERRATLVRLRQLRTAHSVLGPAISQSRTVAELSALLLPNGSSHPCYSDNRGGINGCQADTFVAFPASSTAVHRAEHSVLSALLSAASAQCTIKVEAWGPLAPLGPIRLVAGCYVLHHGDRQRVLGELLQEEADLYGLPPFLRSIRKASGGWGSGGNGGALQPVAATAASLNTHGSNCAHEHLLFPSLRSLDSSRFTAPDGTQAPLVAEELLGLALKHCAFGLVVGEMDQILLLLRAWAEFHAPAGLHGPVTAANAAALKREGDVAGLVKIEGTHEIDTNEGDDSDRGAKSSGAVVHSAVRSRRRDPMLPFVREAAVRAQELRRTPAPAASTDGNHSSSNASNSSGSGCGEWRRLCRVDWLCEGRWASAEAGVAYYGLVYGVALRSELAGALDGATPTAPVDVDSNVASAVELFREAAYYVSAVVELSR